MIDQDKKLSDITMDTITMKEAQLFSSPLVVIKMVEMYKSLGISDKDIVKSIKSYQRDLINAALVNHVKQLSARLITQIKT